MTILKVLALVGAWLFFYKILKLRNKRIPAIKATLITLLFAMLIFRVATDGYAFIDRAIFSYNKQGEIPLNASPLKIPPNQDLNYCKQFSDQNKQVISKISESGNVKYCGEFWQFTTNKNIMLPYKIIGPDEVIYWVSPGGRVYGSKKNLDHFLSNPRP